MLVVCRDPLTYSFEPPTEIASILATTSAEIGRKAVVLAKCFFLTMEEDADVRDADGSPDLAVGDLLFEVKGTGKKDHHARRNIVVNSPDSVTGLTIGMVSLIRVSRVNNPAVRLTFLDYGAHYHIGGTERPEIRLKVRTYF